jgi:hypothetical protein
MGSYNFSERRFSAQGQKNLTADFLEGYQKRMAEIAGAIWGLAELGLGG